MAVLLVVLLVGSDSRPRTTTSAAARAARRAGRRDRRAGSRRCATCASTSSPSRSRSTAAQARREGLEDLDRDYPAERRQRRRDGLRAARPDRARRRPARADRHRCSSEGVAGYYDPRDGRLRVVEGAGTGDARARGDDRSPTSSPTRWRTSGSGSRSDAGDRRPRAGARRRCYEGTRDGADVRRTCGAALQQPRRRSAACSASAFEDTGDLPPFLEAQVLFPYVGGEAFVERAAAPRRRALGARRTPPTRCARRPRPSRSCTRTPTSTPTSPSRSGSAPRVLGAAGRARRRAPGASCRRASCSAARARAAAGWGGDRYELWQSGAATTPRWIMRWRWDTPRDEAEFDAAAARRGAASWARGATRSVDAAAATVTLASRPTRDLAERLAAAS